MAWFCEIKSAFFIECVGKCFQSVRKDAVISVVIEKSFKHIEKQNAGRDS